jgi:hypothetical protein
MQPGFAEMNDRLKEDLSQLTRALRDRKGEIEEAMRRIVDEHPYLSLAAAFAAGYAISGALLSRTTARAIAFGGRVVIARVLKELFAGAALGLATSGEAQRRDPPRTEAT